jgi:hypothetical protein
MKRLLACVDIPHFALQIFLLDKPEWQDEAVVLLDRDEANGRIVDLNDAAVNLGLGKGMFYGSCLGIHRHLKGGGVGDEAIDYWHEKIFSTLLNFSPHIERSWFQDGSYWLNASGLSYVYSSVKPWLILIKSAINELGFECGLAVGSSRFATFAAAHLKPDGSLNIFPDENIESQWLDRVPVEIININDDVMKLIKRLKLLTVGDFLKLSVSDIKHRLSREAARIVDFIRGEDTIPLQYSEPPIASSWSIRPEEPLSLVADLHNLGTRLIDRSLKNAGMMSQRIQSLDFRFIGTSFTHEAGLKPALPTLNRELLSRLLKSRIEYLDFKNPVYEIECQALFSETRAPQVDLFGAEFHQQLNEATKVLISLQSERGPQSVQFADIVDDPMPTRKYGLYPWRGFHKHGNKISTPMKRRLARRIALVPGILRRYPVRMARVVYSGGWWDKPYHYEMAYSRIGERWNWLQNDGGDSWDLVGWVD